MNAEEKTSGDKVKEFLHQFVVGTLAVLVAVNLVSGITYDTPANLLLASLVLGALNAFLRPLLLLGCLPLLILTLGLFLIVINAILLKLTGELMVSLTGNPKSFLVEDFWSAIWGALIISIVTLIANSVTGNGNSKMHFKRGQPRERPPDKRSYDRDDDDGPVIDV
tara:strand:+ start:44 stop:541 length:498 start_codon:yes stop_codon:yes gene_type:complete